MKTSDALSYLPPALQRKARQFFVSRKLPNLSLLFSGCDSAVLTRLLDSLKPCYFAAGDSVVFYGAPARSIIFLSEGLLQLIDASGEALSTVRPGGYVGSRIIFDNPGATPESVNAHSAVAIENATCWSLTRSTLVKTLFCFPEQHEAVKRSFLRGDASAVASPLNRSLSDAMLSLEIGAEDGDDYDALASTSRLPSWLTKDRLTVFWHVFVLLMYAYVAYMVPARAMFLMRAESRPSIQLAAFFLADYVITVFFWMDATFRGKTLARGICIQKGWRESFLLDAPVVRRYISLVFLSFIYTPILDIVFCSIYGVRALQFSRLSSLGLLVGCSARLDVILNSPRFSSSVGSSLYLSRPFSVVIIVLVMYALLNHWYACVWMFLHRIVERSEETTWATVDGLATYNAVSGEHDICHDSFRCYSRALYFTITTLSTVGYGDIRPYTNLETMFQIIVALTGATLFASLIGAIASLLNFKDTLGQKFIHASLSRIRKFLCSRDVSKRDADRIELHMLLAWQQCGNAIVDEDVLEPLTESLRSELALHAKRGLFNLRGMLHDIPEYMAKFIAPRLQPRVFQMSQKIFASGSVFSGLYFVESGKVSLLESHLENMTPKSSGEKRISDADTGCDLSCHSVFVGPGECFGGHGLPATLIDSNAPISLTHLHHRHFIHSADACALTSCLLHILSAEDLEDTLNRFAKASPELHAFLNEMRGKQHSVDIAVL